MRRLGRVVQSPVATVVLWLMLLFDAFSLGEDSTLGRRLTQPERWCYTGWYPMAEIVQRSGAPVLIDSELIEAEGQPGDRKLAFISWHPGWHNTGWWHPTERRLNHVRVSEASSTLTPNQVAQFRTMFVDYFRAHSDPEYEDLVASLLNNGEPVVQVLWNGWILDAVSASVGILFLSSFGWIPRRYSVARKACAMRLGHCPHCKYDLQHDLAVGCPECGWRREVK